MMKPYVTIAVQVLLFLAFTQTVRAENIIEHNGVGMSYKEVEKEVETWPAEIQRTAANDTAERLEFLNKTMVTTKIAQAGLDVRLEDDPELYWKIQYMLRAELERIMIQDHLSKLEVPDMSELASERYLVEKERWAFVPEKRLSSHILILCENQQCNREEAKAKADSVLEKLIAGEDFAFLAAEFSDDPVSKDKGGTFKRWLEPRDKLVAKEYTKALYALGEPGEISPVVATKFGYHIIRLEKIRESHYLEYEDVKGTIIQSLKSEYQRQAAREYISSFNLDDTAKINGPAMEKIFSRYKSVE